MSFWDKLAKPIVGLSPMDGVTDAPMRFITAKYGKPDVIFTEFVSAEALMRVVDGRIREPEKVLKDLKYDESERPIIAQLFGRDPEAFYVAAKKVVDLGFDGVDINMGCPSKNVAERGAGAGLIENPDLAGKIIEAVKRGVADAGRKIPVSVKTRIGTSAPDESWWRFLASQELAVVTMHGRTFKQLYQGRADWESLARAAKIIKEKGTIFLGNGDVESTEEARNKAEQYGTDGVLIGRAALGNPWVFAGKEVAKEERLKVALEHAEKYEELFPGEHFLNMRKHLAWYVRGFENASDLRSKLVLTNSAREVEEILKREI